MQSDTTHDQKRKESRPRGGVPCALQNFAALPNEANVDVKVVAALLGLSISSIWRRARNGTLPAAVKVGPNATRWRVGDLRSHLASLRAD